MADQEPTLPGFVEPPRCEKPVTPRDPQEVRTEEFLQENADLLKLLDYATSAMAEIRARGAAQVVRQEYASGVLHHERPLYYELGTIERHWPDKRGRRLKDATGAFEICGYDAEGRWVWTRSMEVTTLDRYTVFDPKIPNGRWVPVDPPVRGPAREKFLFHSGNTVEGYSFSPCRVERVFKQQFEGDQLRCLRFLDYRSHAPHLVCNEKYEWKDGRVVRILAERAEQPFHQDLTLAYDAKGRIESVVDAVSGRTLFDRTRKYDASFVASLRQRLYDAIVKAVTDWGVKEPVYCLLLAYDTECDLPLPPVIGYGMERDRRRWIETMGVKEARSSIWSWGEFNEGNDDYVDAKLAEDCQRWNEYLQDKDSMTPAKKLVVNLATDLAKRDWSTCLNLTPDFVVVATDLPMEDLDRNVKHSVPPERITQLKKAGLL